MFEWLWSKLPDRCEMPNCKRHGVRGNENVVDGRVMCDDCHVEYMQLRSEPMPKDVEEAFNRFFGL